MRIVLFVLIAVAIQAVSVLSVVNDSTVDGDNSGTWDIDIEDAQIDGTGDN